MFSRQFSAKRIGRFANFHPDRNKNNLRMDSLVQMPRHKWPELRDMFRSNWPQGVVASCLLETQISYPGVSEAFGFKVYCPEGEVSNGMVSITGGNGKGHYQIMIHPLYDSNAIEQALLTTNLIDWKKDIMVPSASSEVIACLERIKESVGVKVTYNDIEDKAFKRVLRRNSKKYENVCCPPNTYVGPLKLEHLEIVDKTWTYHSDMSHRFFDTLMKNDLTYVLYSHEHQPISWITINEAGALTHLYCLEDHRRKGYAEFITQFVVNDLLDKDKDVLAYTVSNNVNPQNLFTKLEFEIIGHDTWVFLNKEQ